jgi:hypothetical protein
MGELRGTLSPKETLNDFSDLRCGRCHMIGNFLLANRLTVAVASRRRTISPAIGA